jgi:hypothetical protein
MESAALVVAQNVSVMFSIRPSGPFSTTNLYLWVGLVFWSLVVRLSLTLASPNSHPVNLRSPRPELVVYDKS